MAQGFSGQALAVEAGKIVQQVNIEDGEVATGTTAMNVDDTIPQNTEGDEYMSISVTPTKSTNLLRIQVVAHLNHSNASAGLIAGALFQDSIADAIAATRSARETAVGQPYHLVIDYWMVAGTTSAIDFAFRAGGNLGSTTTFNGSAGGRIFGGVMNSTMTVTEYSAGPPAALSGLGRVVQTVNVSDQDVATGTGTIPVDNTIPQSSEGTEFMTLAITPKASTNMLRVDVVVTLSANVTFPYLSAALFKDSETDALATATDRKGNSANRPANIAFTHWIQAGSASAQTFRVRCGANLASTTTFNGANAARLFGETHASSITITEYQT